MHLQTRSIERKLKRRQVGDGGKNRQFFADVMEEAKKKKALSCR